MRQTGTLETVEDVAAARAQLERRPVPTLAAFIVSLAQDAGPAGEQARTFIVGDDLAATIESVRARIAALSRTQDGATRVFAGAMVAQRFEYLLESIETLVLPVDSGRAGELLAQLLQSDGDAMERCGDHHDAVARACARAAEMLGRAVVLAPSPALLATMRALVADDAYGTRRALAGVLAGLDRAGATSRQHGLGDSGP